MRNSAPAVKASEDIKKRDNIYKDSILTQTFCFVACENRRPSSLPARVAFRVKRERPLRPGAKKDGCFHRLFCL